MAQGTENISWKTALAVSAVLFGFHVGGGFASGNQTVAFYVQYGWTAVFFPLIAVLIMNLVYREGFINAQLNNANHYKEWAHAAYYPYNKFFANFYEVANLALIVITISACIAGSAALLESYGVPYIIGTAATAAMFVWLTMYGQSLLTKASSIMTIFIVISMLAICYYGLQGKTGTIKEMIDTSYEPLGFGAAVWKTLQYAGFMTYCVATLCPYAATVKNRNGVNRLVLVNFILNGGILCLVSIMLLGWMPAVSNETLPILYVLNQIGESWLIYLYAIGLFCAFISTGIGCIYGFVTRMENFVLTNVNITARRAAISIGSIIVSALVSLVGLDAIVRKGYAYMGIIGIFLMIIPTLTIVAYRNVKGIVTLKKN